MILFRVDFTCSVWAKGGVDTILMDKQYSGFFLMYLAYSL